MENLSELKIAVSSLPPSTRLSTPSLLEHDVNLTKSAILYGDKVEIFSPFLWTVDALTSASTFSMSDKVQIFKTLILDNEGEARFDDGIDNKILEEFLNDFLKEGADTELDAETISEVTKSIETFFEGTRENLYNQFGKFNAEQLHRALSSGIVSLANVSSTVRKEDYAKLHAAVSVRKGKRGHAAFFKGKDSVLSFLNFIESSTSNQSTLPLFSEGAGQVVQAGIEEGTFSISQLQADRIKETALMVQLINRLPLFEKATIDEIIDIRNELDSPLKRFRVAVMGYSQKMKSSAWSDEFASEATNIFRSEVELAVAEIEEATHANKYLYHLWDTLSGTSALVPTAGSALGMVSTALAHLPMMTSGMAGVGVGAAVAASGAYKNWKTEAKKQEKSQMFFYYKAKQRLQGTKGKSRRK